MAPLPIGTSIVGGLGKTVKITPLVIILSFLLMTEVVVMSGVLGTRGASQIILICFCVSFPILIAIPFFWILAIKPWVFYTPQDYGNEIDPRIYINAMALQPYKRASDALNRFFEQLPSDIEKLIADRPQLLDTGDAEEISRRLTEIASLRLVKIELSDFEAPEAYIPVEDGTCVWEFLDLVYFQIVGHYPLRPYTYGEIWAVKNLESGTVFTKIGRPWARSHGIQEDTRALGEIGIYPGARLRAIRL